MRIYKLKYIEFHEYYVDKICRLSNVQENLKLHYLNNNNNDNNDGDG